MRKYFYDRITGIRDSEARQSKTVLHFDNNLKMLLIFRVCLDDNSKKVEQCFCKRKMQRDKQTEHYV